MSEIWSHIVSDVATLFSGDGSAWFAFGQVLLIDIFLAGDNAIVIGALAAGLPADQRRKVILIGIVAALVLRIGFALVVTQLLQVVGLVLAGGLLLAWVAWKMYRELRPSHAAAANPGAPEVEGSHTAQVKPARSFAAAAWSVAVADVSMSLDNVLAVAGAARDHPGILIIGLIFAVALMGVAANLIAKYIDRYRWLAWVGLIVIVFVAGKMIFDGIADPTIGLSTLF